MGVDSAWIDKLKVAEIRSELEKRGVPYSKKVRKSEIADILRKAIQDEADRVAKTASSPAAAQSVPVDKTTPVGPPVDAMEAATARGEVTTVREHSKNDALALPLDASAVQSGPADEVSDVEVQLVQRAQELMPIVGDDKAEPVGDQLETNPKFKEADPQPKEADPKPQEAKQKMEEPGLALQEPNSRSSESSLEHPSSSVKETKAVSEVTPAPRAELPEDQITSFGPDAVAQKIEVVQKPAVEVPPTGPSEPERPISDEVEENGHVFRPPDEPKPSSSKMEDSLTEKDSAVGLSPQPEDAGLDMIDEHIEEQLDYGEEDINASQEVKHLAEPSPSVKVKNKRVRDGHKEDEKPSKSHKTSEKEERAGTAKEETRTRDRENRTSSKQATGSTKEERNQEEAKPSRRDDRDVKEKTKEDVPPRKRKYSPIPAPPPRTRKEPEKKSREAEPEQSKRQKSNIEPHEDAKASSVEKPGRKGSVFDRLDSGRRQDEKDTNQKGAEGKADLPKRGSGLSTADAVLEPPKKGPGAPRSKEKPSCALRIEGFVRPLHQKQVHDLLSLTGTIKELWMPNIKTHAIAIFSTVEEAEATRQALWDVEWPEGRNNTLRPKFLSEDEAKEKIAIATGQEPGGEALPVNGVVGGQDARELLKGKTGGAPVEDEKGAVSKAQEEKVFNLDDLFRKTTVTPALYWLPLTDEQVAEKEAALANKVKATKEVADKGP
eukprot:jgi/Botrbrau1/15169/Bobra.0149s0034.1